jgi:HPt (histidine-containing phosphotransfer) domain-containing protein
MNDYVSKPIQPEKLAAAIERWAPTGKVIAALDKKVEERIPDKAVFDHVAFLDRLGGDKVLVKEILGIFKGDAHLQINDLKEALEKGDTDLVHRQAHKLKGSSGNISATSLQDVAFQMEAAGKDGDIALASSLYEKIEGEYEILMEAITSSVFWNN